MAFIHVFRVVYWSPLAHSFIIKFIIIPIFLPHADIVSFIIITMFGNLHEVSMNSAQRGVTTSAGQPVLVLYESWLSYNCPCRMGGPHTADLLARSMLPSAITPTPPSQAVKTPLRVSAWAFALAAHPDRAFMRFLLSVI